MAKKENLIIIFTRNPELGKVKTRLAKTIGDKSALKIYTYLLNHTEKTIRNIDCDKAVYYSIKVRGNDIWDNSIYQKHLQKGEDLGVRMHNAFKKTFTKDYKKVIIVGSDLYNLSPEHIQTAFKKLEDNDVVIGPAQDGGYYLLGMKTLYPKVFINKKWSTSSVLKNTLQDLKNESVFLLEELNDIDVYDDMKHIKTLMQLITK